MILAVAVLATTIAWRAAVDADTAPPIHASAITADTAIGPGCELNIVVDGEPELSHPYTVDATGCVHFSIADSAGENTQQWSVSLLGMTAARAKAALVVSLSTYFKNPAVIVTIVRLPGVQIEIAGEVLRSGRFVLPAGARVSDLVRPDVTNPTADLGDVLIRRGGAAGTSKTFNVDLTLAPSDEDDDPRLMDGDHVFFRKRSEAAPRAEPSFVHVVGEFGAAAGPSRNGGQSTDGVAVPIAEGTKLRDVIARVGRLRPSADRSRLYLGRADGSTRVLNADRIEAGDPEQNVTLRAGDLLVVPKRDRGEVFAVLGEVASPNTFPCGSAAKITLKQAIAGAGGLSKKANQHRGVLSKGYLLDPTKARAIPFDPDLVRRGEQPDMDVEPGDAVIIEARKKRPTFWQQLLPFALHFLPL